jgi:hypothetical protein
LTCGIRTDATVVCWNMSALSTSPPAGLTAKI